MTIAAVVAFLGIVAFFGVALFLVIEGDRQ